MLNRFQFVAGYTDAPGHSAVVHHPRDVPLHFLRLACGRDADEIDVAADDQAVTQASCETGQSKDDVT